MRWCGRCHAFAEAQELLPYTLGREAPAIRAQSNHYLPLYKTNFHAVIQRRFSRGNHFDHAHTMYATGTSND